LALEAKNCIHGITQVEMDCDDCDISFFFLLPEKLKTFKDLSNVLERIN
jgi:hypothetical protein